METTMSADDVYKRCLICRRPYSAVRLYVQTEIVALSDSGDEYKFSTEESGATNIFYYCDIDEDEGREGCGAFYSAAYVDTGDEEFAKESEEESAAE
jgi:hypothetical protein